MAYQTENTIDKRIARVAKAINLEEGDRVPFAPKIGMAYGPLAGIDSYEALNDQRLMLPGVKRLLTTCELDLYWRPAGYPINVMETLGTNAVRWPGATWNLPLTSGFQLVDETYVHEDEYDELIQDPSRFFMTKVYPRRHRKLAGLAKMNFTNVIEFGHYTGMAAFADPEVRSALITLMHAGDEAVKYLEAVQQLDDLALELQTPLCSIIGQDAPYDMWADGLRG
ncbi:MAG: hypothetical protein LIO58_06290 [Oscillospiraceae bacterium]|nr:hypothetical protein [Oscillospiraceae bacterium]